MTKAKGKAGFHKGAERAHTRQSGSNVRLRGKHEVEARLEAELERFKQKIGMGSEVNLCWLPGDVKYKDGKKLLEEVLGDTIVIYAKNPADAKQLLSHGFVEWILNQHTKPYRQLINKLIALFEEQQYERKEKTVETLAKLLSCNLG